MRSANSGEAGCAKKSDKETFYFLEGLGKLESPFELSLFLLCLGWIRKYPATVRSPLSPMRLFSGEVSGGGEVIKLVLTNLLGQFQQPLSTLRENTQIGLRDFVFGIVTGTDVGVVE